MKKNIFFLKKVFEDTTNLYLISANIVVLLIDLIVWRLKLSNRELPIQTISGLYPIGFLFLILLINFFLAACSFDKEKEISYLLFSATLFIGILILVLETFYLVSLAGYA